TQIVDYLALTGDAVDNVPGVEKVGPKTAAKWIQQYGSLDAVMAHAGEIPGAVGEHLRKALDWLPKGRELLTVKRDVQLPVRLDDLGARDADTAKLAEFFERYGMRTMLREVRGNAPATVAVPPTSPSPASAPLERRRYATLRTGKDLADFLPQLEKAELVGFDTETTGLEPMLAKLVGMSFAFGDAAWYLPLAHEYPGAPDQIGVDKALEMLRRWLESGRHRKVGQNLKFDAHILANHGVALGGMAHDTLLESYVYEVHERHDMDAMALRHLGWKTITYDEVTGKGASRISFSAVDIERACGFVRENFRGRKAQIRLREDRDAGDAGAAARRAQRRADRWRETRCAEPRTGQGDAGDRAAGLPGGRATVQPQLAQADPGNPLRQAEAAGEEKNAQGPALDRRGRARRARARLSAAPAAARLPRPRQAEIHLHRQAAAHGGRQYRARAHHLLPGHRRHRAPRLERSEPAEHPHPHAAGAAHPRGVRRAARKQDRLRRLFADRVAHHGAPLGRQGPAPRFRPRPRCAPGHRCRGVRRAAGKSHPGRTAHCQGDQLRPHLRHERVRPGAEPGAGARHRAGLHRVLLHALSGSEEIHG